MNVNSSYWHSLNLSGKLNYLRSAYLLWASVSLSGPWLVGRLHEAIATHTSLAAEQKWQDKYSGGFVIIGRAGGLDDGPR